MKDLADKINADKEFNMEAYNYIKTQLDRETSKPLRKRDFDRIEQLTSQLAELSGDNASGNTEKLYERIRSYERAEKRPVNVFKRFIPAICCFVLVFTANCVSVAAWNMNIVSAVIEFTKGGFSADFGKKEYEVVELPTSEDDPYGIIAECAKYDIYPETPHYLPEGFELIEISANVNEDFANIVSFTFAKDNMFIGFDFERYWNDTGKIGIPSDKYNISETTVNGNPAIISKEDNQYTITFMNEKTSFLMFTQDVPYDECEKIVASIK